VLRISIPDVGTGTGSVVIKIGIFFSFLCWFQVLWIQSTTCILNFNSLPGLKAFCLFKIYHWKKFSLYMFAGCRTIWKFGSEAASGQRLPGPATLILCIRKTLLFESIPFNPFLFKNCTVWRYFGSRFFQSLLSFALKISATWQHWHSFRQLSVTKT
jgi:hypothetical protein